MKAYKDMSYCSFQFEQGKTYEMKDEYHCGDGFLAYANPLECLLKSDIGYGKYYEIDGKNKIEDGEGSASYYKKITIGEKLDVKDMIMEYLICMKGSIYKKDIVSNNYHGVAISDKCNSNLNVIATDELGISCNIGYGASISLGNCGTAIGKTSVISCGRNGISASAGCESDILTFGDFGISISTGGFFNRAISFGENGCSFTNGCCSIAVTEGRDSIAIAFGPDTRAAGSIGSYILLSEWENDKLVECKLMKVDGNKIKANTLYEMKNGEIVEVKRE